MATLSNPKKTKQQNPHSVHHSTNSPKHECILNMKQHIKSTELHIPEIDKLCRQLVGIRLWKRRIEMLTGSGTPPALSSAETASATSWNTRINQVTGLVYIGKSKNWIEFGNITCAKLPWIWTDLKLLLGRWAAPALHSNQSFHQGSLGWILHHSHHSHDPDPPSAAWRNPSCTLASINMLPPAEGIAAAATGKKPLACQPWWT